MCAPPDTTAVPSTSTHSKNRPLTPSRGADPSPASKPSLQHLRLSGWQVHYTALQPELSQIKAIEFNQFLHTVLGVTPEWMEANRSRLDKISQSQEYLEKFASYCDNGQWQELCDLLEPDKLLGALDVRN